MDGGLCVRRAHRGERPRPATEDWLIRPTSSAGLALARGAWGLLMASYCGSSAWFAVPRDDVGAAELVVARGPSISTARFEHTVWHAFVPNWLVLRGDSVLHAACAVVEGRAFLLMGDSTLGKSTLAAGLALRGVPVLSDDVTRLTLAEDGRVLAWPSYPGVRLRGNSFLLPAKQQRRASGPFGLPKVRIFPPASTGHRRPAPVGGVLLLSRGRGVRPQFSRRTPLQTLNPLLGAQFSQVAAAAGLSQDVFARSVRLAGALPAWEMRYRRSAAHFDGLLDAVVAFMRSAPSLGQR